MSKEDISQVYVDLTTLETWSQDITNLNSDALEILKTFEMTIDDLDNYFKGNFATGFIENSMKFTQKAKNLHNAMKDVAPSLLRNIVTIKENS